MSRTLPSWMRSSPWRLERKSVASGAAGLSSRSMWSLIPTARIWAGEKSCIPAGSCEARIVAARVRVGQEDVDELDGKSTGRRDGGDCGPAARHWPTAGRRHWRCDRPPVRSRSGRRSERAWRRSTRSLAGSERGLLSHHVLCDGPSRQVRRPRDRDGNQGCAPCHAAAAFVRLRSAVRHRMFHARQGSGVSGRARAHGAAHGLRGSARSAALFHRDRDARRASTATACRGPCASG